MRYCIFVCLIILAGAGLVSAGDMTPAETGDKAVKEKVVEQLEEVVVTSTREAEPLKEKPQTIGVIKGKEIKDGSPSHPS